VCDTKSVARSSCYRRDGQANSDWAMRCDNNHFFRQGQDTYLLTRFTVPSRKLRHKKQEFCLCWLLSKYDLVCNPIRSLRKITWLTPNEPRYYIASKSRKACLLLAREQRDDLLFCDFSEIVQQAKNENPGESWWQPPVQRIFRKTFSFVEVPVHSKDRLRVSLKLVALTADLFWITHLLKHPQMLTQA
jgi:hypothetical protein